MGLPKGNPVTESPLGSCFPAHTAHGQKFRSPGDRALGTGPGDLALGRGWETARRILEEAGQRGEADVSMFGRVMSDAADHGQTQIVTCYFE